jgi:hypothetical protein
VIYVAVNEADALWNCAKYRHEFAAEHPDCIPSTVESDGSRGSCTTFRGCHKEIFCFLDCDERITCPSETGAVTGM